MGKLMGGAGYPGGGAETPGSTEDGAVVVNERRREMRVSAEVLEGLRAVREAGLTNMYDRRTVISNARAMGYQETADWIQDNPKDYVRGIREGFEEERDGE